MRWMTVLVVVAACRGEGGDGDGAHVGVDDTAAVGGGDEGGLVWVDAEGVEVPIVEIFGQLFYVDPNGYLWSTFPWSSTIGGVSQPDVVFTDPGCTEAGSWANTPRVVIEDGSGEAVRFFVAPDDALPSPVGDRFRVDEALGCVPDPGSIGDLVRLEEVDAQAAWWTPPLHPEYR